MRALVSVSDKSGLVEFIRESGSYISEIYATGSTGDHLRRNGTC